jgi:hypothetical protein
LKTKLILLFAAPLLTLAPARLDAGQAPDEPYVRSGPPPLRPLPFTLRLGRKPPSTIRELIADLEAAIPESHRARMAAYFSSSQDDLRDDAYQDLYIHEIFAAIAKAWPRGGPGLERRIACVPRDFPYQVAMQIAFDHVRSHWEAGTVIKLTDRAQALMEASFISEQLFEVCDSLPARTHRAPGPSRRWRGTARRTGSGR